MKRKLAFIMAAIMLVTTPASVLASEGLDVSVVSEDIISEDDSVEAYVEETPAEEDYAEEVTDIPEVSYEGSDEAEAGSEDYDVIIEDGALTEDSSADAAVTTEYGDDDFIVAIEEVPTTYSDVSLLDENDDNKCGDNLEWELENGVLTISGSGEMYEYTFSGNLAPWYSYADSITSVEIGNGVESIGKCAFYYCSNLTSITIPNSVTSIGSWAFAYCSSLTSIEIPSSIKSIEGHVFYYCSSLTSIEIPDSVTSIGDYAFYYCSSLTSIEIPDSVTSIGSWAFYYCSSLTSITIPGGITSIEYQTFSFCSSLTSITIPDGVTNIESDAFYYCSSLTSVTIPKSITSIESYAFYNCTLLQDIYYYEGTKEDWKSIQIENYAFTYVNATIHCNNGDMELEKPVIAEGTCGNVLTWTLNEEGLLTISGTGAMYDYSYSSGYAPWYGESVESIVVESGVTSIGELAFLGLNVSSVSLPGTLESIGNYAFEECHSLHEIEIPEGVTSIGKGAFNSCGVTTIYIPHSVSSIGNFAFDNTGLREIYYDGTVEEWAAIIYDYGADDEDSVFQATIYFLQDDADIIAGGGCGDGLFWKLNNEGILTIYGTGSMSYKEDAPWYGKTKITYTVIIEEGVTSIGSYAFISFSSLSEIYISGSVKEIGSSAFKNCTSLTDVYFDGSKSDWEAISISSGNDPLTSATIHCNATDISTCTVKLSSTSYTYNGSAKKPSVTVKDGNTTLKSGTDYTVSYSNNTNAGTATAKVTGKGNYTGTVKKNFTINKASQTLTAKASSSSIVKGKTATITASGKGTITYSSNKKSVATVSSKGKITAKSIGTAKITVKAAGNSNYKSASKTLTIKVIPKATTLKSAKSSSSKKLTVKWKKVSGVSGYQIQYSTNKNFKSGNKTVKVSGTSKVSKTISKLKKGKTYYVRVRTYKTVSGTKYYSSWTSKKKVKVK